MNEVLRSLTGFMIGGPNTITDRVVLARLRIVIGRNKSTAMVFPGAGCTEQENYHYQARIHSTLLQ